MMDRRVSNIFWTVFFAFAATSASSYGQSQVPSQSLEAKLPDSGPFKDGRALDEFQPLGNGTIASRVLQAGSIPVASETVHFKIRILSVDTATREALYRLIGNEGVSTQITKSAKFGVDSEKPNEESARSSYHASQPTVVSTALLDSESAASASELIATSDSCQVLATPSVLAALGQESSFDQTVQRPFVSSLREVRRRNQTSVESELQVVDEGFQVRVCAKPSVKSEETTIEVNLQQSSVAGVDEVEVFGIGSSRTRIQVPMHQVREASAALVYSSEETLFVDPYFTINGPEADDKEKTNAGPLSTFTDLFAETPSKQDPSHLIVLIDYRRIEQKSAKAGSVIQTSANLPIESDR